MYALPRSRVGKWSVALLLVVLLYPLYWSAFMLIPESLRALQVSVGVLIALLAVGSLVLAAIAVTRAKDRSILLYTVGGLTLLLIVFFAIGESFGGH